MSKIDNETSQPVVRSASKKGSLVIDDDHDSDKENTPPGDATSSYIEKDVDQEILNSVKDIVPDAKEDDEQMKNDDNNSDSDGAENENIYY